MTTAAIICELNPFHKGHACLIEHARRAGADRVILLMSGDYVQRGEPSVIDRHARAHMALLAGADLVLSLPTRFATASAETFASSAVRILDLMGCVDVLVFGSESGEIGPIIECASILAEEPDFYREQLRSGLRRGLSFPKARAEALPAFRELLREPNQILGVEYCKALIRQRSSIRPLTVRRIGGSHDAAVKEAADGRMAPESYLSAAAIRTALHRGVSPAMLAGAVPEPCLDVFDRAVREGGIAEPVSLVLLHIFRKHRSLTSVQVDPAVVIHEDARIEGHEVRILFTPGRAVRMHHVTHILVGPGWCVAHCDIQFILVSQTIIQVEASIRALGHIRRVHDLVPLRIGGILGLFVDDALEAPVLQVIHRCGPADIIVHTELFTIETVVRTVDIQPVAEHMGFPIGNILIIGQIRIEDLHVGSSFGSSTL